MNTPTLSTGTLLAMRERGGGLKLVIPGVGAHYSHRGELVLELPHNDPRTRMNEDAEVILSDDDAKALREWLSQGEL